jgi:hypothetical protein
MAFTNEVLDEILKGYSGAPEEFSGPDGLLKRLTKALIERAMEAELEHELGVAIKWVLMSAARSGVPGGFIPPGTRVRGVRGRARPWLRRSPVDTELQPDFGCNSVLDGGVKTFFGEVGEHPCISASDSLPPT